ncbi:unnamed protein product [Closterium sp. Naga37s-1]|nr:unnamed protein product [Closterium sp. Naga37s-1]
MLPVARLKNKAANVRLSLVIEPDSLPNIATNMGMNRCDATTDKEYTEGVAYAIAELSQIPDTTLYLDSGFGGWLGWPEGMKRVVAVYMKVLARARQIRANAKIRGFTSNVANYSPLFARSFPLLPSVCPALEKCPLVKNPSTGETNYDWNPCIDENRFTARMNAYLGALGLPTRWIVDTSRSGRAGIRNRWGSWNYASILREYNHITDLVAIAIRFSKTGQPQRICRKERCRGWAAVGGRRRGIEIEGGWEQAQGYMESMGQWRRGDRDGEDEGRGGVMGLSESDAIKGCAGVGGSEWQ